MIWYDMRERNEKQGRSTPRVASSGPPFGPAATREISHAAAAKSSKDIITRDRSNSSSTTLQKSAGSGTTACAWLSCSDTICPATIKAASGSPTALLAAVSRGSCALIGLLADLSTDTRVRERSATPASRYNQRRTVGESNACSDESTTTATYLWKVHMQVCSLIIYERV